jgi:glycerophosphoryl diester phosphodiesterase
MFVIAHRGACKRATENTLEAFRIAAELGADGVEFDVRRTLDGALVIHHDAVVAGFGLIADCSFAELRAAQPHVPTLAETLDVVSPMPLVNIEMKCCAWEADADPERLVARGVSAEIASRGLYANAVVSSFDLAAIDDVRRFDDAIVTGWLVQGVDPAPIAATAREHGHAWLHPDWGNLHANLAASVAAARGAGIRLDPWTVDDQQVMRDFAAAGVDALITNLPDVARAASLPAS